MTDSFVHLHLHSQYSLLEGAIRIKPLLKRVHELGMTSVAVTDSNNLFGAVDFYTSAKEKGIHPILGAEIQFLSIPPSLNRAPANAFPQPKAFHLVLLCKNYQGYQNLCKLLTEAYVRPPLQEAPTTAKGLPQPLRGVVDRSLLTQHHAGLIALTGCLKGEIPYRLVQGQQAEALELAQWLKNLFGEDLYFELQDLPLSEQALVNDTLFEWSEKMGVRCVASSDCHYLDASDAEAHEILQCIELGRKLDFDRPESLAPAEYSLKSPAEMRARFERYPGACDATLEIRDKCQVEFKFKDEQGRAIYHLPLFRPEGILPGDPNFSLLDYFRAEARKGLESRFMERGFLEKKSKPDWATLEVQYRERLESELDMIARTGFAGYFLIVADFIVWAKKNRIPVGPGRGSGAGSLVAYSLLITDIDPIQFKLLFERFINPERVSMPDFDVDFCQDRRGEVIEYVSRKYGAENVSQIITFGKLQARAVVKDVGRVLGLSFDETDEITKLFPDELNISLGDALSKEPKLQELIDRDPKIAKVFQYARSLEGLYRNAGVHAAGVIITEMPIVNYCPMYMGREGDVVTQFDKDFAEKIGLVKFDFLGLKTLTVIQNAVDLIRASGKPGSIESEFALDQMGETDARVFELVGSGDTDGIFQVESSGMKDLCTRLKPNSIEDLTAINALYRPGPLGSGMVDDFIERKHGRKPIVYELPELESILIDTYGVILYQEQVMQIARELAGYSLGQADMLRRAMGKKKPEEMAKQRETFTQGAVAKGIPPEKATSIFDLMAKFAEYGFNKSHSAAYAMITYQTAYLKAHYPEEFLAALMTTEMSNTEKLAKYIHDARAHGIAVLVPDVNRSQRRFSVEDVNGKKAIRFALEAVKGVGSTAVDAILEARRTDIKPDDREWSFGAGGPFDSTLGFVKRVSTRKVNKKVIESLTRAGAFDSIAEVNRPSLLASIDTLLEVAASDQEEQILGQSSLFSNFSAEEIRRVTPTNAIFASAEDWPQGKRLSQEKELLGFYLSGHPMDGWQSLLKDWLGLDVESLRTQIQSAPPAQPAQPGPHGRESRREIKLGGLFSEFKEITTKKGSRMAFAQLEDLNGRVEVVFFPEAFQNLGESAKRWAMEVEPVLVTGDLDVREGEPKLLVKSIQPLKDVHAGRVQNVRLALSAQKVSVEQLRELKQVLMQYRGKCPITLEIHDPKFNLEMKFPKDFAVQGVPGLVASVNRIFGYPVIHMNS